MKINQEKNQDPTEEYAYGTDITQNLEDEKSQSESDYFADLLYELYANLGKIDYEYECIRERMSQLEQQRSDIFNKISDMSKYIEDSNIVLR